MSTKSKLSEFLKTKDMTQAAAYQMFSNSLFAQDWEDIQKWPRPPHHFKPTKVNDFANPFSFAQAGAIYREDAFSKALREISKKQAATIETQYVKFLSGIDGYPPTTRKAAPKPIITKPAYSEPKKSRKLILPLEK